MLNPRNDKDKQIALPIRLAAPVTKTEPCVLSFLAIAGYLIKLKNSARVEF